MTHATELLASCAVDVPDCEDTLASVFELPLVLGLLAVLLIVGIASAVGLRDASSARARTRTRWWSRRARSQEIRPESRLDPRHDAADEPELRS